MHIIFSIVSLFFGLTIGLSVCAIGWFSLIADSVRPVSHRNAFCVFQPPLQDGLPTRNAYDIRQVVQLYGDGSGWLRHGSGWLRYFA